MSPLDSKLILDALDKLFAEQNAKWDRRFADMDAAWDRLLAPQGRAQVAGEQRDAAAEPRIEQPAHDPEERELDLSAFGSAQIRNECGLSSIVPVAPLDVVHKPATVSDATSTDGCIGSDLHRTHPIDFDRLSILPDVILRDIVSRLPIKEAARTAVLSRR